MHILHYLYGMPPYRGGGMIKYALDLIEVEERMEHEVTILYPGSIVRRNSSRIRIKKDKPHHRTTVYRIQNPLPIPLGNGIKDFEWFMSDKGFVVYEEFLKKLKPDVIHIHSLMGIHRSFFEAAKQLQIRMVYTSHDYFGLCPTMTLMKGQSCCEEKDWEKCSWCCRNAFSDIHLMLDQFWVVQKVLQTQIGKKMLDMLAQAKAEQIQKREAKADTRASDEQKEEMVYTNGAEYQQLREYYRSIFQKIDVYHFNSVIAKTEFEKRLGAVNGCVIPILNGSCTDRRRKRQYGSCLRVGFLGEKHTYKGFPLLYESVRDLYQEGTEIVLNTYFGVEPGEEPFWKQHLPYQYTQIEEIMNENDVIVVPSIWKETFGLVVTEALSFGVPVLVSENVGSGMLLEGKEETGRILRGNLHLALKKCLKELSQNKNILEKWNANICEAHFDFSMEEHGERVVDICYEGK